MSNLKHPSDLLMGKSLLAKAADLLYLLFVKFGVRAFAAAIVSAMQELIGMVSLRGVVSKVFKTVIGCVPIVMTHLHAFRWLSQKREGNKLMNANVFANGAHAKADPKPAVFLWLRVKNFSLNSPFAYTICDFSVNASNASKVGRFISTFIAGDWKPMFLHDRSPLSVAPHVGVRQAVWRLLFGGDPSRTPKFCHNILFA